MLARRLLLGLLTALAVLAVVPAPVQAQASTAPPGKAAAMPTFLRIATGGVAGVYFPLGSLIARAVAESGGAPDCPAPLPQPCGVPGLLAVAQSSNGSVANVQAIQAGAVEAALVQSDIAYWAYSGSGVFAGKLPATQLSFLARLYPEAVHVVVRRGAGIRNIADLAGRRVSLDEPGSGTLAMARALLAAHGLSEARVQAEYIKPELAGPRLMAGELDAFLFVGGWPLRDVAQLAAEGRITLLPITGAAAADLLARNRFLSRTTIPAGVYPGQDAVETVTVTAQLLARADLPENLVEAALRQLWSQRGQDLVRAGHPRGVDLSLALALEGRAIPLHAGAARFYKAAGMAESARP